MESVFLATKRVLSVRKWFLIFLISSLTILLMYLVAIELSASFEMFIRANSKMFISLQIIFTGVNSILGGLSITFILYLISQESKISGLSSFQSIFPLVFAIGTTGCYVCGTILIPIAALSSTIGTLPFAGLELKVLTSVLLLISVMETTPKILGICGIQRNISIKAGSHEFGIRGSFIRSFKYLSLSLIIMIGFFMISKKIPDSIDSGINENNYICEAQS